MLTARLLKTTNIKPRTNTRFYNRESMRGLNRSQIKQSLITVIVATGVTAQPEVFFGDLFIGEFGATAAEYELSRVNDNDSIGDGERVVDIVQHREDSAPVGS